MKIEAGEKFRVLMGVYESDVVSYEATADFELYDELELFHREKEIISPLAFIIHLIERNLITVPEDDSKLIILNWKADGTVEATIDT